MAKYETVLSGNFDEILRAVENGILTGSSSASFENGSDYIKGDVRCAVRVYERYSMLGGNRVSLNVTLIGNGEALFLSAITSGGSRAMLLKMNTFGEDAFLDCLIKIIEQHQ